MGIWIDSAGDDEFLRLWDVDVALIIFKYISLEFGHLFEVDSLLSRLELKVYDGFLEI